MQLGILTFLRRSPKALPPTAPQFSNPPESASAPTAGQAPTLEQVAATPIVSAPQDFRSERYGYTLTLPAGWRAIEPRSIAGSPPIDRFTDDRGTSLSIWNEPCPFRTLPDVPSTERAGTLALADGALVPFVAFAPSQKDGAQLLEGRWSARGKRWTIDVQEPFSG
ncbi:MAG TPA: hypothetical protein VGP33_01080, partial [Chloroflexota bacterium]|nr:hypothetical protein [Chloroflexota bacterium]